jgi:hypothetical protein
MLLESGLTVPKASRCSEDTGESSFAKGLQDCYKLKIISWEWERPMVRVFG